MENFDAKNTSDCGAMWILGLGSFRVIGLSKSQMQAFIMFLTNESSISTIQIHGVATIKLEPNEDDVFVLFNSKDDVCKDVDLSNTKPLPFINENSTLSQIHVYLPKFPYMPLYMMLTCQGIPSRCPPLHPHYSSIGLSIVVALRQAKST